MTDNGRSSDGLGRSEENRIREAYARRPARQTLYSWFSPGHAFMVQRRELATLATLKEQGFEDLSRRTILDVGCGEGFWLRELVKWGASPNGLYGVDLLPDRLRHARRLCPAAVDLAGGSGALLPFRDETFDLVLQSTVFTSILDFASKRKVAAEMIRVLQSDGVILWYDYHVDNPRNPDVRGVRRREILDLFPGCRVVLHRVTLAPPIARRVAPISWILCDLLEKVPFLRTHYLGVITKRGQVLGSRAL